MNIKYKKVAQPPMDHARQPVILSDKTYENRHQKVLAQMKEKGISTLVVYADKEHGSNFEYLTGFIPRFEEGLQILTLDGRSQLVLGNENINKVQYARVKSSGILFPQFSLPNQPMQGFEPLDAYLDEIEMDASSKIGFVDWKLLNED